ncbi:hypothetical protein AVMA1855_25910 [Acidovorax sp. SUPP1855]|nr:hypothetical protein AVMA1855_25910 [Acidovorax sp. SUPP1855]
MLVLLGLFVNGDRLCEITKDFIRLKRRFYPALFPVSQQKIDTLLLELKGSDIRTDIRKNPLESAIVEHHFRFLDEIFALLKKHEVKLTSRIWVKGFGKVLNEKSVYTKTTQQIAVRFQKYLEEQKSLGIMVMDYRDSMKNSWVANSVFTQQFKVGGNAYPNIAEIPTFGVSDNHAVLQICDLICSSVIYPIAGMKFCKPLINNAHTHANYVWLRDRYSRRLKALQFHCVVSGQQYWGITASNELDKANNYLF